MTEAPAPAGPKTPGRRGFSRWLDRVPLRVKLVVAVLTLVMFALGLIGVASVLALRDYLVDRVDGQLRVATAVLVDVPGEPAQQNDRLVLPSDFLVALKDGQHIFLRYFEPAYQRSQLPTSAPLMQAGQSRPGEPFTVSAADHSRRWRMLVTPLDDGRVLAVGEDLSGVESAVRRLILINLLVGFAVLGALAAVGVWVVRASLRPLVRIEQTAAAIAGGDLAQRVPELDARTELGRLSGALNTMLAQIESAFLARAASESAAREAAGAALASEARAVRSEERMRQFVADASHELRTPLTTIRGFAELFRQGAAGDSAAAIKRIEDEAARMGLLVEDLLLLARLDRERPLLRAPVALAGLIRDAAGVANALAPDRRIAVELADGAEQLVVDGDEARLRQVIANLVTNALSHTPPATPVTLRLRPDGDRHAVFEVSDAGPGLTAEQAERVFERFYRVDKARTRRAATPPPDAAGVRSPHTGAGLGLAIVAALVAAHGGTVHVQTALGEGATFRVRLPVITPAPPAWTAQPETGRAPAPPSEAAPSEAPPSGMASPSGRGAGVPSEHSRS